MSYRRLFFLALLAGLPTMTWAQFTTYIPPQREWWKRRKRLRLCRSGRGPTA